MILRHSLALLSAKVVREPRSRGCYQGMQVKTNSEELGLRTTAAVVLAIFAVIVLDAFFAVLFTNLGWA